MVELPITTSETDFAVYLIQADFKLLGINYEPRSNGNRKRGIFVFKYDPRIDEYKQLFQKGQAAVNLADMESFKKIKSDLLDRIMRELP
jgi:hypothetical protein